MSTKCLNMSFYQSRDNFFSGKFKKITKVMKPVLKLISKRQRINSVTPSSCTFDVTTEKSQNETNECEMFRIRFKFCGSEVEDNARNEELEDRFLESVPEKPQDTYRAVPVRFVEVKPGMFAWTPLPDADIREAEVRSLTGSQIPEEQTPVFGL